MSNSIFRKQKVGILTYFFIYFEQNNFFFIKMKELQLEQQGNKFENFKFLFVIK